MSMLSASPSDKMKDILNEMKNKGIENMDAPYFKIHNGEFKTTLMESVLMLYECQMGKKQCGIQMLKKCINLI